MSSAAELFVIALARASQRARRHLQGLEPADRDDILATAVLWCWENRGSYTPAVSLDTWFVGAIRNARAAWQRGESREACELTDTIAVPDDTSWSVEVRDALEAMTRSMDAQDQTLVGLMLEGYAQPLIAEQLGVSVATIKRRLARLRSFLPESASFKLELRKARGVPTPPSDSDRSLEPKASIDKDIERLEFMPQHGRDCPPCWRCTWFEGFLPGPVKTIRLEIAEPETRAAVWATEGRKVEIAMHVRAGTINE